jgi:hypothetical protein
MGINDVQFFLVALLLVPSIKGDSSSSICCANGSSVGR